MVVDLVGWRADRLDTRLAQGRLAGAHVAAVARGLALWHAEQCEPGAVIVSPAERLAIVRERCGGDSLAACEQLERNARIDAAHFAARAALASRLHGALALDTVYVDAASRATFDAPAASLAGDPALDVAALVVDLRSARRGDLAERLAAAYAESADDFALYGVLDFCTSLIALERAGCAPAERPIVRPSLVAVEAGVPGAAEVAVELGAPLVAASQLRETAGDSWSLFLALAQRAAHVLDSGRSVVVAGSFASPSAHRALERLARERGVALRFVERSGRHIARVRTRAAHPTFERSTRRRAPLLSSDSSMREEGFE